MGLCWCLNWCLSVWLLAAFADYSCYYYCNSQVLRSYDTRFCPSNRRPHLYLDNVCAKYIVGQVADEVLKIPDTSAADNTVFQSVATYGRESFWTPSPKKQLLVIATPFRKGRHLAKRPKDFLPIINHLETLHDKGYVHGDIRAFNVVFPEEKCGSGYLIDFDFSGKPGEVVYPKGYSSLLPDGDREGEGGEKIENGTTGTHLVN